MTSNGLRSNSGCLTCRQRHLKCDEARPICWRCEIGSRECKFPTNSRARPAPKRTASCYKASRNTYSTPVQSVRELEWTGDINSPAQSYELNSTPSASKDDYSSVNATDRITGSNSPQSTRNPTTATFVSPVAHHVPSVASNIAASSQAPDQSQVYKAHNLQYLDHYEIHRVSRQSRFARFHAPQSQNQAETEEFLLQHYVKSTGKWFTMADAGRHFTNTVPRLARSSQILMKALCALAARHLSRITDYDTSIAENYHEECIALLISALNDPSVTADEATLAALEHMKLTDFSIDPSYHLSGTSAFVRSILGNVVPVSGSGLQEACFWAYLRQCLYVACINREPLKFDISTYQVEMALSTPPTSELPSAEEESVWVKYMMWVLAEVVEFCFNPNTATMKLDDARSRWRELATKVEMWDANKPRSFMPVALLDRNLEAGRIFPLRWFGDDWHAVAIMYLLTAHILLDVYDPLIRSITIGQFGFLRARQALELKVLTSSRALCGICLANPENIPLFFTLCHTIFTFASFMGNAEERNCLLSILRRSEHEEVWPTGWITRALMEEWDMSLCSLDGG